MMTGSRQAWRVFTGSHVRWVTGRRHMMHAFSLSLSVSKIRGMSRRGAGEARCLETPAVPGT